MGILPACQQTNEDAIDAQVELPPERSSDLLPELYTELRELAASRLARENDCITLQATDLVHEAYLRIAGRHEESRWNSKGHFFGAASLAMRRILIERARRRISQGIHVQQRPCELFQLGLLAGEDTTDCDPLDLLALNDALEQLEASNPRCAKLVELRFFAGLSNRLAAEVLGISTSTADEDWRYAKAWLRVAIDEGVPIPPRLTSNRSRGLPHSRLPLPR